MGECEAAVEDYNRAIHIQPENAEYYRRRAEVLDRMGRYSEAEANRSIAADLTH
jgi:Flp pilus assembly protein TadD